MNRWRLVAVLLVASAGSAAGALVLHWQPCRGNMLDASVLTGFADGSFSDACLRRMDTSLPFPFPPEPEEFSAWATGLGNVAMVCAALAGLVVAIGLRVAGWLRALVSLPAVLTVLIVAVSIRAAVSPARDPDDYPANWLLASAEIAAVVAVVAMARYRDDHDDLSRRTFWVVSGLLWSITVFGFLHQVSEYLLATVVSEADWDNPPTTGTLTVVVLLVGAAVAWFERGRRPPAAAPGTAVPRPKAAVDGATVAG